MKDVRKGTPLDESASFEPSSVKIGELNLYVSYLRGYKLKFWVLFHLFAQMLPIEGFPPYFAQL